MCVWKYWMKLSVVWACRHCCRIIRPAPQLPQGCDLQVGQWPETSRTMAHLTNMTVHYLSIYPSISFYIWLRWVWHKVKKKQIKEIPQNCHDEWSSFPKHLLEALVSVCLEGSCRQVNAVTEASSLSLTCLFFPSVPSNGSHGHNKVSLMAVALAGLKFCCCWYYPIDPHTGGIPTQHWRLIVSANTLK